MLLLLCASPGAADDVQRGLLSPTSQRPAHAEAGESFSLTVSTATALTPPPGIQEPRAHRAFGVWLCASGISLGAPARICFPLAVENLRPLASHSLEYRVDVVVPRWVAPGFYELGVRFPGGTQAVGNGLRVGSPGSSVCQPVVESVSRPVMGVRVTSECDARLRVHLAGSGGLHEAAGLETYPLPTESGEFGDGVVALVGVSAQRPLLLLPGRSSGEGAHAMTSAVLEAKVSGAGGRADLVSLEVRGAPAGARIFWRLSPWQSALGARTTARFGGTSRAGTASAAVIGPDATLRILRTDLSKLGGTGLAASGCQVGNARGWWVVAGLLFMALSRKLGPRRRPRAAPEQGKGGE